MARSPLNHISSNNNGLQLLPQPSGRHDVELAAAAISNLKWGIVEAPLAPDWFVRLDFGNVGFRPDDDWITSSFLHPFML